MKRRSSSSSLPRKRLMTSEDEYDDDDDEYDNDNDNNDDNDDNDNDDGDDRRPKLKAISDSSSSSASSKYNSNSSKGGNTKSKQKDASKNSSFTTSSSSNSSSKGKAAAAAAGDPYAVIFDTNLCAPCTKVDHLTRKNCKSNIRCVHGLRVVSKGKLAGRTAGFATVARAATTCNGSSSSSSYIWSNNFSPSRLLGPSPSAVLRVEGEPCGLFNLGSTCYLNVILQIMFHNISSRLAVYLVDVSEINNPNTKCNSRDLSDLKAVRELQLIFRQMEIGDRRAVKPDSLINFLGMDKHAQQDPQEFFKLFLVRLEKLWKANKIFDEKYNSKGDGSSSSNSNSLTSNSGMSSGRIGMISNEKVKSIIEPLDSLYSGIESTTISCSHCNSRSVRSTSFTEVKLFMGSMSEESIPIASSSDRENEKEVKSSAQKSRAKDKDSKEKKKDSASGSNTTPAKGKVFDLESSGNTTKSSNKAKAALNLQSSLDSYFSEELLFGENRYMCSNCGVLRNATKKVTVGHVAIDGMIESPNSGLGSAKNGGKGGVGGGKSKKGATSDNSSSSSSSSNHANSLNENGKKWPYLLQVQLLRYRFDKETGARQKIRQSLQYPAEITLDGEEFFLSSTIYHKGESAYGGHYVCDVLSVNNDVLSGRGKKPLSSSSTSSMSSDGDGGDNWSDHRFDDVAITGEWFHIDDDTVRKTTCPAFGAAGTGETAVIIDLDVDATESGGDGSNSRSRSMDVGDEDEDDDDVVVVDEDEDSSSSNNNNNGNGIKDKKDKRGKGKVKDVAKTFAAYGVDRQKDVYLLLYVNKRRYLQVLELYKELWPVDKEADRIIESNRRQYEAELSDYTGKIALVEGIVSQRREDYAAVEDILAVPIAMPTRAESSAHHHHNHQHQGGEGGVGLGRRSNYSNGNMQQQQFHFVPSKWLDCWVNGDFSGYSDEFCEKDSSLVPKNNSNSSNENVSVENNSNNSNGNNSNGVSILSDINIVCCDDDDDGEVVIISGSSKPKARNLSNTSSSEEDDFSSTSSASSQSICSAQKILSKFYRPINMTPYTCPHGGLNWDKANELKVISHDAYLKLTESVSAGAADIVGNNNSSSSSSSSSSSGCSDRTGMLRPATNHDFNDSNFRCRQCVAVYEDKISKCEKLANILKLIEKDKSSFPDQKSHLSKASSNQHQQYLALGSGNENDDFYVVSMSFISEMRKICHKSLQNVNFINTDSSLPPQNGENNSLTTTAGTTGTAVKSTLDLKVNSNLLCTHGMLQNNYQKKSRVVMRQLWRQILEVVGEIKFDNVLASSASSSSSSSSSSAASANSNSMELAMTKASMNNTDNEVVFIPRDLGAGSDSKSTSLLFKAKPPSNQQQQRCETIDIDNYNDSNCMGDSSSSSSSFSSDVINYRLPLSNDGVYELPLSSILAYKCSMCQQDIDNKNELKKSRADEVSGNKALNALYKRKTILSSDFKNCMNLHLTGKSDFSGTKFYLIDHNWLDSWRDYISNTSMPTPRPLTNTALRCSHGSALIGLPLRELYMLEDSKVYHPERDPLDMPTCEVLNEEQWCAIVTLYGSTMATATTIIESSDNQSGHQQQHNNNNSNSNGNSNSNSNSSSSSFGNVSNNNVTSSSAMEHDNDVNASSSGVIKILEDNDEYENKGNCGESPLFTVSLGFSSPGSDNSGLSVLWNPVVCQLCLTQAKDRYSSLRASFHRADIIVVTTTLEEALVGNLNGDRASNYDNNDIAGGGGGVGGAGGSKLASSSSAATATAAAGDKDVTDVVMRAKRPRRSARDRTKSAVITCDSDDNIALIKLKIFEKFGDLYFPVNLRLFYNGVEMIQDSKSLSFYDVLEGTKVNIVLRGGTGDDGDDDINIFGDTLFMYQGNARVESDTEIFGGSNNGGGKLRKNEVIIVDDDDSNISMSKITTIPNYSKTTANNSKSNSDSNNKSSNSNSSTNMKMDTGSSSSSSSESAPHGSHGPSRSSSDDNMQTLRSFGFSSEDILKALAASGNDFQRALDNLLAHS